MDQQNLPPTPPPPPQQPGYAPQQNYGTMPVPPVYPHQNPAPTRWSTPVIAAVSAASAAVVMLVLGGGLVLGLAIGQANQSTSNPSYPGIQAPSSGSDPQMPSLGPRDPSTNRGASATTATPAEEVGLVYINTQLGYQNAEAAGTGMILTSDGVILTNHHVVSGASQISVQVVSTGKTYSASVVGYDKSADVAVLQLKNASGLTPVKLNTNGKLKVGDSVTAVGNANGDGGDASAAPGTVTGLNQSISVSGESDSGPQRLSGLIQMDADVIPGDSGGAVYDSQGKVVGMTTAASQGSANVTGYAIPINAALSLADQIRAGHGTNEIHIGPTAFFGVQLSTQSTTPTVVGTVSGSPAAATGITAGSVITAVDGQKVSTTSDLTAAIGSHRAGERVTIYWTDPNGASQSATVTLMEGPVG